MKRILILIMLLVLVAAAINLAAAIGFWWYNTKHGANYDELDIGLQEVEIWRERRQTDWPLKPGFASINNNFGITSRHLGWIQFSFTGIPGSANFKSIKSDSYRVIINEFGWPMRCIAEERWEETHKIKSRNKKSEEFPVLGAPAPNCILWTGLVFDILFYCVVIALTFNCWIYIRRINRLKRGVCLHCNYDLRGNSSGSGGKVCPECGSAIVAPN